MSYEDAWWTSFYVSILTAYILSTNIVAPLSMRLTFLERLTGKAGTRSLYEQEGSYSYLDDMRPESAGDVRAG